MLCISCHCEPLKPLPFGINHAKLLDVRQTMRHVVKSAAVDKHMSQSDDVYL